jgi:nicotinamidase-related amidase
LIDSRPSLIGGGALARSQWSLTNAEVCAMKSCLVLIDAQESFRQRPYFTDRDLPAYVAAQNALIAACVKQGVPIVRIFHVDGPKTAENPFALESGFVKPLKELTPFEPAATFHKGRHSALVGTGLDVWLTQNGIGRLIISGIRTEQCCETTARHASDLGFQVDYVTEATLTWDMKHEDGSPLPAADIKARTAAVLKDRFARICSAPQAIDRLATAA